MRIWSLHPKYLDAKGLVALWRETLLARKVLQGNTRGYKNHPQLKRFIEHKNPLQAINAYLWTIADEAKIRRYSFDTSKLSPKREIIKIKVNSKQIEYEFTHLANKLKTRDKQKHALIKDIKNIDPNPIFIKISGEIELWEKIKQV